MKKLLLHSCCGPCSTQVIDVLKDKYDLTVYYYNPNIDCQEEFAHRLEEQKRFCSLVGVPVTQDGYDDMEFVSGVKGLENEKEGGARCPVCFALRLRKTAQKAKELQIENFTTSIVISPHKNFQKLSSIGTEIAQKENLNFLAIDFKKKDGFLKTNKIANSLGLYRQNYCGCKFSIRN